MRLYAFEDRHRCHNVLLRPIPPGGSTADDDNMVIGRPLVSTLWSMKQDITHSVIALLNVRKELNFQQNPCNIFHSL